MTPDSDAAKIGLHEVMHDDTGMGRTGGTLAGLRGDGEDAVAVTDIVERLRYIYWPLPNLHDEAADEIERLRAEIQKIHGHYMPENARMIAEIERLKQHFSKQNTEDAETNKQLRVEIERLTGKAQ